MDCQSFDACDMHVLPQCMPSIGRKGGEPFQYIKVEGENMNQELSEFFAEENFVQNIKVTDNLFLKCMALIPFYYSVNTLLTVKMKLTIQALLICIYFTWRHSKGGRTPT